MGDKKVSSRTAKQATEGSMTGTPAVTAPVAVWSPFDQIVKWTKGSSKKEELAEYADLHLIRHMICDGLPNVDSPSVFRVFETILTAVEKLQNVEPKIKWDHFDLAIYTFLATIVQDKAQVYLDTKVHLQQGNVNTRQVHVGHAGNIHTQACIRDHTAELLARGVTPADIPAAHASIDFAANVDLQQIAHMIFDGANDKDHRLARRTHNAISAAIARIQDDDNKITP